MSVIAIPSSPTGAARWALGCRVGCRTGSGLAVEAGMSGAGAAGESGPGDGVLTEGGDLVGDLVAAGGVDRTGGQRCDNALEERADDGRAPDVRVLVAELAVGDALLDDTREGGGQAGAGVQADLVDVGIHRLDDHGVGQAAAAQGAVDEGGHGVAD